MSAWKVLFTLLFAAVCFALLSATVIIPLALKEGTYRWLWFGGLLLATMAMSTLFALFLKRADRSFHMGR